MIFRDNVFLIPVGDLLDEKAGNYYLVYAPLHDRMQIVSNEFIQDIGRDSSKLSQFESVFLEDADTADVRRETGDLKDVETLYIVLNYKCNFHCSYCYSAGGRSQEELSQDNLKGMIEMFLGEHTRNKERHITFIGGGEPFLSPEKMKEAIEIIRKTERKSGCSVSIEIVTNGSLLTPESVDFLKLHNVTLQVSFEILEDVQEKQRAGYRSVSSNIISASAEIPLSIRSVITDFNVTRLEEMVEEVHTRYPKVKTLRFDVEESRNRFACIEQAEHFYQEYNSHFLRARRIALQYGISVDNFATRIMNRITSRFCNMMLCLVPNGCVTSCVCYSSEKEDGFSEFVYGKMGKGVFTLYPDRFDLLRSQNVFQQVECADCFLKWHCGGGCVAHRMLHDNDLQTITCESTRDLIRKVLLQNLEDYVQDEYNCTLADFLKTGEKQ